MPKVAYEPRPKGAKESTLEVIAQANSIIESYAAQGYNLTLRQLYYQFVSRDLIANKQTEYKRLGDIISKGRRWGMVDWNAIVDRTRNLQSLGTWESPSAIVEAVAQQFRYDRWLAQPVYVEVWFEKDALMGVFERVAHKWRLPFFSCRGYTSDSEVWGAAQRLRAVRQGADKLFHDPIEPHPRDVVILHFGDHDPSGIDMTRDIRDRLHLFGARGIDVRRMALNMDQVEQYDPPPNPAKESDSRFVEYQALHGDESWELDALEPTVLAALVEREVQSLIDPTLWATWEKNERRTRAELKCISDSYDDVVAQFAGEVEETMEDLDDDEEIEP